MKKRYLITMILSFIFCFITFSNKVNALDNNEILLNDLNELENKYTNYDSSSLYATKRIIIKNEEPIEYLNSVEQLYSDGYYYLQFETEEDCRNAYEYYLNSNLQSVEIDTIMKATSTSTTSSTYDYVTWGAESMNVDTYTRELLERENYNDDEIIIAVLDSGIDTDHEWFTNRIATGGANYSDSFMSGGISYEDEEGHGTHVSGIIVDLTPSNVKILPIKVLNASGSTTISRVKLGIDYVIGLKKNGMNIVAMNLSLSGEASVNSTDYNSINTAISNAYNAGIIAIVAAGNEGDNVANHTPGNVDRAITVGSVYKEGETYQHSSFSNYGNYVDICAPGENILSASRGGGTVVKYGTSMAAPHVSALVALLYMNNSSYKINDIERMLTKTIIDLGTTGMDNYYGNGLANLAFFDTTLNDYSTSFGSTEGIYSNSFYLTLTSDYDDATIYYTKDGSTPTKTNIIQYTGPIIVDKTMIIKAVSIMKNNNQIKTVSRVTQQIYYLNNIDLDSSYTIDNNGTIVKYSGQLTTLVVPSTIKEINVNSVGDSAFQNSYLISVTLSSTITTIGTNAFKNSIYLQTITATGVEIVENYAFDNCASLSTVNMPNLVTINTGGFENTSSLNSITTMNVETLEKYSFYYSGITKMYLPKIKVINDYAIYNSSVTSIVVGNSLTSMKVPLQKNVTVTIYGYSDSPANQTTSYFNFVEIPTFQLITDLEENKIYYLNEENAQIGINATGYELTYKWYYKNDETDSWSTLDNTSSTLNINTSAYSKKIYKVKITNWDGQSYESTNCNVLVYDSEAITMTSVTSDNGSITPKGINFVLSGSSLTYTFTANNGYHIKEIIIDGNKLTNTEIEIAKENGYTFSNITSNHQISVNYEINTYAIELIVDGNGSISPSNVVDLKHNESQTYYFTADTGHHIANIFIDNEEIGIVNSYSFTNVTSNHSIKVVFEPDIFTISVKYNLSDTTLKYYADYGTNKTITFENGNGYKIGSILVDGIEIDSDSLTTITANGYTLTNVCEDHYINVNFELAKYNIILIKNGNGTVNPGYDGEINILETMTYKFYPNDGYHVEYIKIDGQALEENELTSAITNGYTFANVTSNHKIEVKFAINSYQIIVDIIGEGTYEISNTNMILYGENRTYYFYPNTGYYIAEVKIDGNSLIDSEIEKVKNDGYTFKLISENHTISIKYLIKKYTVTISSLGYNLEPISLNANYGSSLDIQFENIEGYSIRKITINDEDIDYSNYSYSLTNITKNITIVVNYSIKTYTIKFEKEGNGTINYTKDKKVNYGDTISVSFYPDEGSNLKNIYVNGVATYLSNNILTLNNIKMDYTIKAIFTKSYKNEINILSGEGTFNYSLNYEERSITYSESKNIFFNEDEIIDYRFNANEGYYIKKILLNGIQIFFGNVENYSFTIERINIDYDIEIYFEVDKYQVVINETSNGIIITDKIEILHGENVTITFIPNEGYHLKEFVVLKDNVKQNYNILNNNQLVIENIDGNLDISATYEINSYEININVEGNGTSNLSGKIIKKYNEEIEIVFSPYDGYGISKISLDGNEIKITDNKYVLKNIDSNHSIDALFVKQYLFTSYSDSNGTVTESKKVNLGDDVTYYFNAKEGYEVDTVYIDDVVYYNIKEYTFYNVDSTHTIAVTYKIKTYSVYVKIYGEGEYSYDNYLSNVEYGSNRTISFTSKEGYHLSRITINGESVETSEILNLNSISSDMNILVFFEENKASINVTSIAIIVIGSLVTLGTIFLCIKKKKIIFKR